MAKTTLAFQYITYTILVAATASATYFFYNWFNDDWILFREGEKRYNAKDFSGAVVLYKKAIDKGLPAKEANVQLANAYVALGNFDEAVQLYREHLKIYPKDQAVRLSLAKALSWVGKQEEAEVEYKKILEGKDEKQIQNNH